MDECIFCDIVAGKTPSYKVYEDEHTVAILDIFPIRRGQVLVIPKIHTRSKYSEGEEELEMYCLQAARKVAALLEQKLQCERCFIFIEGLGVNHFHVKVYPHYGGEGEFRAGMPDQPESDAVLQEILDELK